jgi:predicted dehydrogenase
MNPVKIKVKFAVIGCGHIGKRHAEMIQRNAESQLVAHLRCEAREAWALKPSMCPISTTEDDRAVGKAVPASTW